MNGHKGLVFSSRKSSLARHTAGWRGFSLELSTSAAVARAARGLAWIVRLVPQTDVVKPLHSITTIHHEADKYVEISKGGTSGMDSMK